MVKGNWLPKLYNLFSPTRSHCLSCGKWTSGAHSGYPELCRSCYDSIPWIRQPRCPTCGRAIGCPDCTRLGAEEHRPFIVNRSAVIYDAMMREWLAQYKYRGNEAFAPLLSRMMLEGYMRLVEEFRRRNQEKSWGVDIVTYVPVSPSRLRERGFNQAECLARSVAMSSRALLLPLLARSRDTEKQSLKTRDERLHDMRNAFELTPFAEQELYAHIPAGVRARPLRVLLCDDIYTTGSTISACSDVLLTVTTKYGMKAEIYSLTWARS